MGKQTARKITHIMKNSLFVASSREFFTFLVFLVLSGAFWLLLTLNEVYEQEVKVPIRISNVPQNVVLTSEEVDTIRVTLKDNGLNLLFYYIGDNIRTVNANFVPFARRGEGYGVIPGLELQRIISPLLMSSTRITALKPDRIEMTFNYGLSKKVPVMWKGVVKPEDMYYISNTKYTPDSVLVYATRQKLDSITVAYTTPLNITSFRDTLSITASIEKIKNAKVIPDEVGITFSTDVLTEEDIHEIPVEAVNVPKGKIIRTFPSKISVRFVTGVGIFRTLSAKDFKVVVDYNDSQRGEASKLKLYLQTVPHDVSRVKLSVSDVDYIIEDE